MTLVRLGLILLALNLGGMAIVVLLLIEARP